MKTKIFISFIVFTIFNLFIGKLQSQIHQEWAARYNGPLISNSDDYPTAIVKDQSGNIIVTGYTFNNLTNKDFYTIKLNTNGLVLWNKIFTNTNKLFSSTNEQAVAVAVDNLNNIYVAGSTDENSNDFLLIKYNFNGDTIWSRQYNGPGNYVDRPVVLIVDDSGYIYIAGESFGTSPNNFNYTVLKYNSNGNIVWEARYAFPPVLYDRPTSMKVDNSGYVYVTGYSNFNDYDYLTVKFNSSGLFQWDKRYEGPANYKDYANDIAIDHSENIYVTGISCQSSPIENYDCATVKYNSNGDEIWVRRYNGPGNWWDFARSIKFDLNDNVYISGYSEGITSAYDILTIKYDSSGAEQWVARYNGTSNDSDKAFRSEVDENGNVYVVGQTKTNNAYDIIALKNNTSGNLVWDQTINGTSNGNDIGRDILLDNSNIYITGETNNGEFNNDFTIAKYNRDGVQSWIRTENERTYYPSNDYPNAITIDPNENIYVGGASQGDTKNDFTLIKYSSSGNELWTSRYDGEANGDDQITDIVIDKNGNSYAIGYSKGINTNLDMLINKYDFDGNILWTRKYDNSNHDDIPYSMSIDSSDNIYFTGYSKTSSNTEAIVTLKYNSGGVQQWVNVFANGSGTNRAYDIALDDFFNVYLTGIVSSNSGDFITLKINSQGIHQWSNNYNHSSDEASSIAIDDSSNVYVTGIVRTQIIFSTSYSIRTIKYNNNGIQQWVKTYGSSLNYECRANEICVDKNNNIIIAGFYPQSSGTSKNNYLTIKYKRDGTEVWSRTYDGSSNDDDKGFFLKTDAGNNIYVTGQSYNNNNLYDITTIKYDSLGVLKWQISYDGPISSNDIGKKLIIDNSRNIYVCGQSIGYGTENDFVLIKYNQSTIGIQNNVIQIPQKYFLYQNYPNPFNPSTVIRYSLIENGFTNLVVYDILGNEVATLVAKKQNAGNYSVDFNGANYSSGIYYYKLEAGNFSEVRKMILIK